MARRTPGRRGTPAALITAALTFVLVLGTAPAQALPAWAPPDGALPATTPVRDEASPYRAKTESAVRAQLEAKNTKKTKSDRTATSRATFWVALSHEADSSAAREKSVKTDRTRTLYESKTAHAERTQAPLKALLEREGAAYESFWIVNTIKVTAGKALAEKIAARPEVAALEADDPLPLPEPLPGRAEPGVNAVEWNVDRINAPKVWSGLGVRGEGIVVANIDTGVDFTHPALKTRYRGLKTDGTHDHDYHWFDPTRICSGSAPCDNNGHGTHTMGTMAGDGGAGNQVGAAPGARWIAAKGCEDAGCSRTALMRSGQWIVAPTDRAGAHPRPELAPDVVNNSWGARDPDPWYAGVVQAWRDAGIFPAFANGNHGPRCASSGVPGAYATSYSTGAFDSNNTIAPFSSRGPGDGQGVKPDIAAPGVNVRSAWTGGGYHSISGTSMASPHTAAAVALIWSAAPALRGKVAETERILDGSAVDTEDLSCGGTAADNNVWGEGRLDAYAAVLAAPRGPLGAVTGTVTTAVGPLADAVVRFEGPMTTAVTTAADGGYRVPRMTAGDYRITVTGFGYLTETGAVTVVENGTAVKDFTLTEAPHAQVTGKVTSHAGAEAGATVKIQGTPATTTSGPDGTYRLRLPLGAWDLVVTPGYRCAAAATVRVEVSADAVKDFALADRTDAFGTACTVSAGVPFPRGETQLPYPHEFTFDLPFPVPFYGRTYRSATYSASGVLAFGEMSHESDNQPLPMPRAPNAALYPFWDDIRIDAEAGVYWSVTGTAPHRKIVVEWRNLLIPSYDPGPRDRVSVAAVVGEDGTASFHYKDIGTGPSERGEHATIGVENGDGTDALMFSYNEKTVRDGMSIHFRTTKTAVVSGTVTDANDGKPVADAAATAGGVRDTTAADGQYALQVPAPADHDLAVTAPAYVPGAARVAPRPGGVTVTDLTLDTGRVTPHTPSLTVVVPAGQQRTRTLTLHNTGSPTPFTLAEKDGKGWIVPTPTSGDLARDERRTITLAIDTTGALPGSVLRGTLRLTSQSGRTPVLDIPVTVAVPAYQTALDTGATAASVDPLGDTWTPDTPYAAGGHGHLGKTSRQSTNRPIVGVPPASDPKLYRTARQGTYEYRFDGLSPGTYRVELGFAELDSKRPAQRVFDVMAEGTQYVPNLDLALEAGVRTVHDRAFTVQVTDGQLNLRFVANTGKTLVNTIRVTERPDLTG
ncbi:S8 family serine peptidase [Streptomyces sp. NPDC004609]|uniref:S8 family serine peptidase n=1 Tax=Streptomyces sp. NPDC004609 TaxID=3364704 RepID=UPI0036758B3E